MEPKIGDRVGAILFMDEDTVHFLGYGTYNGDQPCPMLGGLPNPKITLDDLNTVWGCQCWWGSESEIKAEIQLKNIIPATIGEVP